MLAQELLQHGRVPLPNLAQHPAHGLVDQVFLVAQQFLGDPERIGEIAVTDEPVGRHNADSPLPEAPRFRQAVERFAAPGFQVAADDLRGGKVYEVPVVDMADVRQVKVVDPLPSGVVALLELADENDQGQ